MTRMEEAAAVGSGFVNDNNDDRTTMTIAILRCLSHLGVCLCNVCIVQRQKEEERERSRKEGERKSSRRLAAGSSYSFFF
jgi:hypothetical protein